MEDKKVIVDFLKMSATLSELVKELSVTHYVLTEIKKASIISIPKYRDILSKITVTEGIARSDEELRLLNESVEFYGKLLDSIEAFAPEQATIDGIEKVLIVADNAPKAPKEEMN